MTASVARFIESFIPENYNLFLDINRSEKTFYRECCHYW